jgi:FtsP/CotA-like multicopper oxidase with cupredoxin domain
MNRNQRLGLLLLAVAALIAAFIALSPGGSNEDHAGSPTPTPAPAPAPGSPAPQAPPPAPKPDPGPLLTGDKVRTIVVSKGDTVRFRVRSAVPEEVHIHGYDIKRDIPAGKTLGVSFKATIDGIFVIEFEKAGKQIASLRVNP